MKRGLYALLAVTVTVPAVLACGGGVWDQAFNDAVKQEFDKMDGTLYSVSDSPEKDAVKKLLEQGRRDALAGKIGIIEVAQFQVDFDQARKDGTIDTAEAEQLMHAYDEMVK